MALFDIVIHCPVLLVTSVAVFQSLIASVKILIQFELRTPGFERILTGISQLTQCRSHPPPKLVVKLYGSRTILI